PVLQVDSAVVFKLRLFHAAARFLQVDGAIVDRQFAEQVAFVDPGTALHGRGDDAAGSLCAHIDKPEGLGLTANPDLLAEAAGLEMRDADNELAAVARLAGAAGGSDRAVIVRQRVPVIEVTLPRDDHPYHYNDH